MDLLFACRYPFTSEARSAIEENNVEIGDLIAEKAVQRIVSALKGEKVHANPMHISDQLVEIGSYGAARMMLAFLHNRYLINKFAVAEAKRASSAMGKDENENPENIKKLQTELGIYPRQFEGKTVVPLPAFLTFSPRSIDYRLINRNVKAGFVEVNSHEIIRLMEEAVKIKAEKISPLKDPPQIIREYSVQLMKLVPKQVPIPMSFKEGDNPPCIEKLLDVAKSHQNLGHQGRWALAVYLINKGMSDEKINQVYSNFPDYDERISKYQVKHARDRGYKMPACVMMMSYGLCVADCRVGNPLRWKKR
jgi:DNA primase large subunit